MFVTKRHLVFFWVLLIHAVNAQRAIFSLAKRLKRQPHESSTSDKKQHPSGEEKIYYIATAACLLVAVVAWWTTQRRIIPPRKRLVSSADSNVVDVKDVPENMDFMDIGFEGIRMELATKKGTTTILDGSIAGSAKSGRMLGILGPSGAGKSSVLHALAGRVQRSAQLKLYGRRFINGQEISGDSLIPSAFVEQDASFFPYMTVRETLSFRVELKLGSTLRRPQRDAIVNDLILELGLSKVADSIVGDDKVRGISGGERKRLSIAVEMISAPKAIFLDEPTSGLDSTAAAQLVDTLRKLADGGRTIVAVIHQPSQHVFSQFDDVLLVSEGRQMYFGPRSEVRAYMESNGCMALPETGTAEHILDCISPTMLLGEKESEQVEKRLDRLATIAAGEIPKQTTVTNTIVRYATGRQLGPRASLLRQCKLLFGRAMHQLSRGRVAIILKLAQQLTTALIYGGIYNLGTNQASIQDRFGLMSLIAIGTANVAIAQTIRTFPKEKAIVSKELSGQLYRTLPYFIGKAVSELPVTGILNAIFGLGVYWLTGMSRMKEKLFNFISVLAMHGMVSQSVGLMIGAVSPNSDVALAIFPAVLVLNIIFDGKNISEENTPKLLRWIPKVGLIRWGFEGFCVNEFKGLKFDKSGPRRGPFAATGEDALAQLGLGKRSIGDVLKAQGIITGATMLLSFIGLALTRQNFQRMMPPESDRS